jgi:hypothetical protein
MAMNRVDKDTRRLLRRTPWRVAPRKYYFLLKQMKGRAFGDRTMFHGSGIFIVASDGTCTQVKDLAGALESQLPTFRN